MSSGVDNRVISTVVRHHSSQGAVASMWGWKLHTLAASEGLISADRDSRQRRMPPFVASVKQTGAIPYAGDGHVWWGRP